MRRLFGASAEALIIVTLVFGLLAVPVFAAKGGNGGGGRAPAATVTLVVLSGDDSVANHTEQITFNVETTATDRPFVSLHCWQGSTGVYNKSIGIFDSYLFDPWFTLDSSYWTSGVEASCTARVYHYDKRGNQKDLATVAVIVAP